MMNALPRLLSIALALGVFSIEISPAFSQPSGTSKSNESGASRSPAIVPGTGNRDAAEVSRNPGSQTPDTTASDDAQSSEESTKEVARDYRAVMWGVIALVTLVALIGFVGFARRSTEPGSDQIGRPRPSV